MKDPRKSWNQPAVASTNGELAPRLRQPKSPRWAMLNAFVDHQMRNLSRAAVVVWWVLFRETNNQGLSRITIEQIGEKAGISVGRVSIGLRELRALKMVVQVSRGNRNKGPSIHRLLPVSTCRPRDVEDGKRTFSTCRQRETATYRQRETPQKEQEHRPPLGASAVQVDGEEEVRTLRIATWPTSQT